MQKQRLLLSTYFSLCRKQSFVNTTNKCCLFPVLDWGFFGSFGSKCDRSWTRVWRSRDICVFLSQTSHKNGWSWYLHKKKSSNPHLCLQRGMWKKTNITYSHEQFHLWKWVKTNSLKKNNNHEAHLETNCSTASPNPLLIWASTLLHPRRSEGVGPLPDSRRGFPGPNAAQQ